MCRLLFSFRNTSIKPLLADFLTQSTNTEKNTPKLHNHRDYTMHQDGFGIAWKTETAKDWAVYKQPHVYTKDPDLDAVIEDIPNHLVIAHIRKQTHGDVSMENTHPFHYQNQVFVQNGSILDFETHTILLQSYICHSFIHHIKGQTDSECLFFMLLSVIKYLQHRSTYVKKRNATRKKHSKSAFSKKQIDLYEDIIESFPFSSIEQESEYALYIKAFHILISIFKKYDIEIVMNIIYGGNDIVLLSRYIYYNKSKYDEAQIPSSLYWNKCNTHGDKGILITSEPLFKYDSVLMPENTLTIVDYKKYELIIHTFARTP